MKKNMKEIVKYKVSGDMKGLLGYFEDKTYYHIHSDELSKLEKWILNMFILTDDKRMEKLDNIMKIQLSDPANKTDNYMRGLSNGLILAKAILTDKDPMSQYLFAKEGGKKKV